MKKIRGKLAKIEALVAQWEVRGEVDGLERDLTLELLREVYAEIKFGAKPESPETKADIITEEYTVAVEEVSPDVAEKESEIEEPAAVEDLIAAEEPSVTIEEVGSAGIGKTESAVVEETPAEEIKGPAVEIEEELLAGKEESTVVEEKPAMVEVPEPPIVPRRVAPEVIRSLYGDEPETEDAGSPTGDDAPVQTIAAAKTHEDTGPRITLGDVMAAGHRTLGETLRTGSEASMASKIAASERPGLRRSIGLNDRFLMIRDMFDGDAAAFDRAIERLDAFTDLDEAAIWIHDNFDWSPDNKGRRCWSACSNENWDTKPMTPLH